jgi:hypothetical protein
MVHYRSLFDEMVGAGEGSIISNGEVNA